MRKLLVWGITFLFMVTLISCQEEDTYTPSPRKMLPAEIVDFMGNFISPGFVTAYQSTRVFEYDSQNRISKITSSYVSNGQKREWDTIESFEYEGDNITVIQTRSDDMQKSWVTNYTRQGSQILISGKEGSISIDEHLRAASFTYDKWGNVQEDDGNLSYDLQNGIFRYVNMPSWYLTTQMGSIGAGHIYNNCIRRMKSVESGYEYQNIYNEYDYPTHISRVKINLLDGSSQSHDIKYIPAN